MFHQTFLFLGQLWQLFEVSQILEFLRYFWKMMGRLLEQGHLLPLIQYRIYPAIRQGFCPSRMTSNN